MSEGPLVDHLFRRHAGMMTAVLTRIFGSARLGLVEDVVQDALLRALEIWPYRGVPANPTAWLLQVAKNRALDIVRRDAGFAQRIAAELAALEGEALSEDAHVPGPCGDDVLAMLFMCCHPDIPREARVALALKTVAGLGTAEIARAFVHGEATIAQRIVRAKRLIAERPIEIAMPVAAELPARRDAVLETLYLWFNEGYLAHDGPALVRADLCHEALRLARMVALHPATASPEGHALAALMALLAARLPARMNEEGDLLLLRDQDRRRWDRALLGIGFRHLQAAAAGDVLGAYHVEAGIAACHAAAESYERTDWAEIVRGYRHLDRIRPSPVVTLNLAIARSRIEGPDVAIAMLQPLLDDPRMRAYRLLPGILGELHAERGDPAEALRWVRAALAYDWSDPARRFLEERAARYGAIAGA